MSAKKDRKQSSKAAESRTYGEELKRALNWVLKDGIFDTVTLHGNANWTAVSLVQVAVFWVWHPESSLVTAAGEAIAMVNALFGPCGIGSYQTLTNALATYSKFLVPVMWRDLQQLMELCGGDSYRVGPWVVLAVDGSRVGVPRTRPNEQRFCKPSRGKKNKRKRNRKGKKRGRHAQGKRKSHQKSHYDPQAVGPQMWLTLVWHIGLRMPWCWKTGPSYSSERAHVLELLEEQKFPESTLFCGDAGFVGYQFWSEIQQHHHHFLMRVGSNVRLLKRLGYVRESHGIVWRSPISIAIGLLVFLEENFSGSPKAEAGARSSVEEVFHFAHLMMGDVPKVGSLGIVLTDQTIRILIRAPLMRATRIGKV